MFFDQIFIKYMKWTPNQKKHIDQISFFFLNLSDHFCNCNVQKSIDLKIVFFFFKNEVGIWYGLHLKGIEINLSRLS